MRRITFVVTVGVLALVIGTVPASAAVTNVNVDGVEVTDGRVTEVLGSIDCTFDQRYVVLVHVRDASGNNAIGRADGLCSVINIWVTDRIRSEQGFTCGEPLLVRGVARTPDDGDRLRFRERVTACSD